MEVGIIDCKSFGIIDEQKHNNKYVVQIANSLNVDAKDVLLSLKYDENEKLYCKNFLKYKVATKLNLYTIPNFDCDKLEIVINRLSEKIRKQLHGINIVELDYKAGKIYIKMDNHEYVLQTDTLYSMQTLWRYFIVNVLKRIEPNWIRNYCDLFNIEKAIDIYRDYYFLLNIEKWAEFFTTEEKEIFGLFNNFSKLTHSLGNFVLVPDGYNVKRYAKTKDFIDLTLIDLQTMKKDNNYPNDTYQWYCENIDIFLWDKFYGETSEEFAQRNIEMFFERNDSGLPLTNKELKKYLKMIVSHLNYKN